MSNGWDKIGLSGAGSHDGEAAVHVWASAKWVVFSGCLLAIPAFYLELLATSDEWLVTGRILYGIMAACLRRRPGMVWAG